MDGYGQSPSGRHPSERLSVGVQFAGVIDGEEATYRPFARLRAYDEDIPAYVGASGAVAAKDVTRTELSLGSRVEWLVGGLANATIYASGAIDYVTIDSSLNGDDDFFLPRLGFGFSQIRPSGAVLSIDLDAGQVVEDTYDVGILFKYSFGF